LGDDALNDRLSEERIDSLKLVWDDPGQFLGFPDALPKSSESSESADTEAVRGSPWEDSDAPDDPVRVYLRAALPVAVAVCAAAVADWRVASQSVRKIKKRAGAQPPALMLAENPDILGTLSRRGPRRPALIVGFAAETDDLERNARRKLEAKGCDWIVANDVSREQGTFGGVYNTVKLVRADAEPEAWPKLSKVEVAERLVMRIAEHLRKASVAAA
jgi:phosphopantothenoylcysteine synthetase/decarboxylase